MKNFKGLNLRKLGLTFDGITFDSRQEMYFYWWAKELFLKGMVAKINVQPEFILFGGREYCRQELTLKKHVYHADFCIDWTDKGMKTLFSKKDFPLVKNHDRTYIEIKPIILADSTAVKKGPGRPRKVKIDPNKREYFSRMNIKWVLDKFGVYVQVVVVENLFKDTFYPLMHAAGIRSTEKQLMVDEYLQIKKGSVLI